MAKRGRDLDDPTEVARLLSERGAPVSVDEVAEALDVERLIRRQRSLGSTNPEEVREMCSVLRESLEEAKRWEEEKRRRIREAKGLCLSAAERASKGEPLERWGI